MQVENAVEIAKRNDSFRRRGLEFMVTPGVQALNDLVHLIDEVRTFSEFTKENDPYGEHSFGVIYWHGEKAFWEIDYYDPELKYGRHPLDDDCKRVLTIMLASEY